MQRTLLCLFFLTLAQTTGACVARSTDGPLPSGDDDGPELCDASSECPLRACQEASTCFLDDLGEPSCGYQNLADDTACDAPGSDAGAADGLCMTGVCVGDEGPTPCDATSLCGPRPCQEITTCFLDGDGQPSCGYQDATDDLACDLNGSATGTGDGLCVAGSCVDPGPPPCASNDACGTGESCISGYCAPKATAGETCDAGPSSDGDDADCASGYLCESTTLTCLGENGVSCSDDLQCLQRCIAGTCANPNDVSGTCDSGQNDDCAADLICHSDSTCRIADGQACASNDECANTCVQGLCQAPASDGGLCDHGDDADCATSACPYGVCGTLVYGQVFVIEVRGYYASTGATLTEIEFFDDMDTQLTLSTTDTDAYDATMDAAPTYWTAGSWGRANLTDTDLTFTNGTTGSESSTIFLHDSGTGNPNATEWARFAVFLDSPSKVSRMTIALGNSQRRIPYQVDVYLAPNYDFSTQVAGRDNTDLLLLWSIFPEDTTAWRLVRTEETTF